MYEREEDARREDDMVSLVYAWERWSRGGKSSRKETCLSKMVDISTCFATGWALLKHDGGVHEWETMWSAFRSLMWISHPFFLRLHGLVRGTEIQDSRQDSAIRTSFL